MHLLPREVRAAVDGRRSRAILPNLFKVGPSRSNKANAELTTAAALGADALAVTCCPALSSWLCICPLPALQISANPETWPQLNSVLPPANYADGRGVAAALCQQDGAAAASSGAGGGADRQQGASAAANGHSGSSSGTARKSGRGSALFDFGAAYPGESPAERMRRVSMSAAAWEQAQLETQQQAAEAAGGEQQQQGAGQPPAGLEQQQRQQDHGAAMQPPPTRRRSMSDALRSRPQQPAPRVASSGGRGKFDASLPVEFGERRKSSGGGSGTVAKLAPAVARGSDLDDASYYGGDGTSTYGGSYHGGSYYEARCGGESEIASWSSGAAL